MKEIVVATKNAKKIVELKAALAGLPVRLLSLAEVADVEEAVEDGVTFEENALKKAQHYLAATGRACLADDSGLEVDALGGAPGVYSARYGGEAANDAANNAKLLSELATVPQEKRTARFRCVLVFLDLDGRKIISEGACEGSIGYEAKGEHGFGYDPLFRLADGNRAMAELTMAEKNAISHRGNAVRVMAEKLKGVLG
ncbi:XTP/dITP diphosphatase [Azotosporobacter soli]|uniref:XTP/dITP diphosphatase n=1 Tax=Azotosporobacter soli TaxID=3055040 RepID=UPI0031FF278D